METTELGVGIDLHKPVVAEERAGVVDMYPLPRLRRLLTLPKCWSIWISTVFVANLAVVYGLFDRRIESRPPHITAGQLLTARTAHMRFEEQLRHPTAKRLWYHNAYSPQQHIRFDCKLVAPRPPRLKLRSWTVGRPSTDNARKNRVAPLLAELARHLLARSGCGAVVLPERPRQG